MHVTAIIAAGGVGSRLGAGVPKQLLELGGRTILERSVQAFATHPRVNDVIVVLPAELASSPPPFVRAQSRIRVVEGGSRRQDSVAAAFDVVGAAADVVLVHDAARPFVTADVISRSIDAAAEHGAAIVGAAGAGHREARRVRPGRRADRADAAARGDLPGADASGVPARRAAGCGGARPIRGRRDRRSCPGGTRRTRRAHRGGDRGQREDHDARGFRGCVPPRFPWRSRRARPRRHRLRPAPTGGRAPPGACAGSTCRRSGVRSATRMPT